MTSLPTPLIRLHDIDSQIYAKIEYQHPSGSIKHRSIPRFLESLLASGELRVGQCIAIRSVGAAALTTAWAGARLGCPVVAVLPPFATDQTARAIQWLGGTCHRLPPQRGSQLMAELTADPEVYVLAQANEERLIEHYRPVAAEVLAELAAPAAFTVGIGTGLSSMGIAREVRARGPQCAVYGIEPAESAVASGQPWTHHPILGLAPPIPQPLLDTSLLAEVLPVPSDEALHWAQAVARTEGLLLGPSSGIAVAAAVRLRKRGLQGPIVAICACSMAEYIEIVSPLH